MIDSILAFLEHTGFAHLTWGNIIMFCVAFLLMYLAIKKRYEPFLLIPISLGIIMANIPPIATNIFASPSGSMPGGLMWYIQRGLYLGIYPPVIFLGIGALTDFSPLIANPKVILLGAAAQSGIFSTFIIASLMGFDLRHAASIAIIGGADGPTSIFISSRFAPELLGVIAIAAYSYMALVPIIQPPIMRLFTTKRERMMRMKQLREVSKKERMMFPIVVILFCGLLVPQALPLISMMMIGNFFRECGVVNRLAKTSSNAILDTINIFLGISVGATTRAEIFLTRQSLQIFFLGAVAFAFATASGVIFAKLMNLFLPNNKVNPLIGAAGVSAIPDSARVSQMVAQRDDPSNFILMHAMGPNVAGVIGSALAAGIFLAMIK